MSRDERGRTRIVSASRRGFDECSGLTNFCYEYLRILRETGVRDQRFSHFHMRRQAGIAGRERIADVLPNYLLSAYSIRRSWAEKNRPVVVRFLKAVVRAKKWFEQDRKAATEFLAKEFQLTPSLAEKGLDYYLTHQAWHPELDIEMDGLKTVVDIYAEQNGFKGQLPNPEKYVDQSYLRQALKELGLR